MSRSELLSIRRALARALSYMERIRLVHLAGYGGPYPGSFIPMLRAVMGAAAPRLGVRDGVHAGLARARVAGRAREDGIPYRFSPEGASRRELTAWVADLLAEQDGPTVLHTHFTAFDVAAAVAGGGATARP